MTTTLSPVGFDAMSLGPATRDALRSVGYNDPTPIQAALIPPALEKRDVMGQAQTGTGKTAAFLIPILESLGEGTTPQAIILAPTRELVCQVHDEAQKLRGESGVRVAAIYGGQPLRQQIVQLERGVEVVVGTPGRVLDLMRRGCLRLDQVHLVVLDEADRMLDIGFRPDIERILRKTPSERQTLLLSATIPPPVAALANRYMRDPMSINLSPDQISVETIKQSYFTVDPDRKLSLLLRLLVRERPRQCIIFCQMKVGVRKLAGELGRRIRGVMAMRGDMPQPNRNRVMKDFRDGKIRVLVATDVVGRGIDVQGISHVINYDIPDDIEAYVHRIGRTGRMGADGTAFTLVTPEQGKQLTAIESLLNHQISQDTIEGFVAARPRQRETEETAASSGAPKPRLLRRGRSGGGVRRGL